MIKRCKRCNSEKDIIMFSNQKASKDGLNPWCKDCNSEYKKIKRSKIIILDIDLKTCSKCFFEKGIDCFGKGSGADGYNIWCKSCTNEFGRNYYISNS